MKYLLLLACLILCFCSSEKEKTVAFYFDEKKFKSEWDIWKSQDIKNYSFTLKGELPYWDFPPLYPKAKATIMTVYPAYPYETKITVKNGVMDSFEYTPHEPISITPNPDVEPEYTTISDMYQKMYDNIKGWESSLPEFTDCLASWGYEIEYNQEFHYITSFKPTWKRLEDCIFETTAHEVTASDFTILPP